MQELKSVADTNFSWTRYNTSNGFQLPSEEGQYLLISDRGQRCYQIGRFVKKDHIIFRDICPFADTYNSIQAKEDGFYEWDSDHFAQIRGIIACAKIPDNPDEIMNLFLPDKEDE